MGYGQFEHVGAVDVDAEGNVYVTDLEGQRVQKFAPPATPVEQTSWGRLKSHYR